MQSFTVLTLTILFLLGCSGAEHSCGLDPDGYYYVSVQINEGPDSGKYTYVYSGSATGLLEVGGYSLLGSGMQFKGADIHCFDGGVRVANNLFHFSHNGKYSISTNWDKSTIHNK